MSNIESAFKVLSTNEGEPDSTLTLRKLLIKRINEIKDNNEIATIDDIGLTHNLFLTSNFKPFVSTASTYLNSRLSHYSLGSFTTIYLDQLVSGDFINDIYIDVEIDAMGDKNNTNENSYKYRYTKYPGIRLLEKVELWLDGKKVDSYTYNDVLFYLNCELDTEKRNAYMCCVGETPLSYSYVYNPVKQHEEIYNTRSGYQTFKNYQNKLHMQIPLLFWFNKYIEKSYPVIKQSTMGLDNSKNFIKIWFADIDKIIQVGKYNSENDDVDIDGRNETYFDTFTISQAVTNFKLSKPEIDINIYVNNIFVNNEIRDFYKSNVDMYSITTHHSFSMPIHKFEHIKIKDLCDMTPYMYIGFKTETNEKSFNNWHKFTNTKRDWYYTSMYQKLTVDDDSGKSYYTPKGRRMIYDTEEPIISEFSLVLDTLPYVNYKNPSDYVKYLAQRKDDNHKYSFDNGIYLLKFCRKFSDYDISGHINFSKIQEVILNYKFSENMENERIKLFVSSRKINLLNINENEVNLKWDTYVT
jgi:hypothetical protein